VAITTDQLHRWHRFLFREDFGSAGKVRRGSSEYPVVVIEGDGEVRRRPQRGSDPQRIGPELDETCRAFQAHIDSVGAGGGVVDMTAGTLAATRLYASILRIHPYEDGNLRAAFVALQAALRSQGMWAVYFDDIERHDKELGWALRNDDAQDRRPFANLLVERLEAIRQAASEGTLES